MAWRHLSLALAACLAKIVLCHIAAVDEAEAQQISSGLAQTSGTAETTARISPRPENLFSWDTFTTTAPGSGVLPGTTRTVTSDLLVLRSDLKIDLAPQWELALRGDLPLAGKDPIAPNNPNGDYFYGLGDADIQAVVIRNISARWAAGAGLRIVAPTGTDNLTAGTWQALPIAGARVMLPELTTGSFFVAVVRYDISFAAAPWAKTLVICNSSRN